MAAVFLEEVKLPLDEKAQLILAANLETLCWILEHNHNQALAKNLAMLIEIFERMGVKETYIEEDYSI